jgi:hypothetical protein
MAFLTSRMVYLVDVYHIQSEREKERQRYKESVRETEREREINILSVSGKPGSPLFLLHDLSALFCSQLLSLLPLQITIELGDRNCLVWRSDRRTALGLTYRVGKKYANDFHIVLVNTVYVDLL